MQSKASKASIGKNSVGTQDYASFEKLNQIGYDGRDDVWAVGLIFSELVTGKTMQERGGQISQYMNKEIENRRLQLIQDIEKKEKISSSFVHLLKNCLQPLQAERPTSAQLLSFFFISTQQQQQQEKQDFFDSNVNKKNTIENANLNDEKKNNNVFFFFIDKKKNSEFLFYIFF
jgi:serine/threonine protein kinase